MSNPLVATAWGPINIAAGANAVYTHTATKTGNLRIQLFLDSVAGGATDYIGWITIQRLGAGTEYPFGPLSTFTSRAGWTALGFLTITVDVTNTDVIKVYVDGQAGDIAVSGYIRIYEDDYLRPVVAAQYGVDVTATGGVGIDWANIEAPTTVVNLSGTTIKTATDVETDTANIQTRLPAALVGGRIDASVGAMANNVLTAAALAADAVTEIAAGVWDYLTAAAVTVGSFGELIVNNLNGAVADVCGCVVSALTKYGLTKKASSDIDIYRGDTWTHRISGLGDLTANTDIWFGVKTSKDDADTAAIILISRTVGLERINGAAATVAANGSITVIGAATDGVIDVELDEVETAKLTASKKYYWDVQKLVGGDMTSPKCGVCLVTADVVRATS